MVKLEGGMKGKAMSAAMGSVKDKPWAKYIIMGCIACCILPAIIDMISSLTDPNSKLIACKFGDMGGALEANIQSNTVIKNIQETMTSSADVSKSVVKNSQEITIEEADDFDDSSPRFMKDQECPGSGLMGLLGFTEKRPAYGCSYDITQDISVSISEIKEDIVNSSEEINNAILNNMEAEVSGTAGPGDKSKAQDFFNEIRDESEKLVAETLIKVRDNSIDQLQKADVIQIRRPKACPCSGSLKISQGIQFEIYAQELSEDIRDFVQEKAIESDVELKLEGAKQDTGQQIACMLQIVASCACCLGIIYVIYTSVKGKSAVEMAKVNRTDYGKTTMNQQNIAGQALRQKQRISGELQKQAQAAVAEAVPVAEAVAIQGP